MKRRTGAGMIVAFGALVFFLYNGSGQAQSTESVEQRETRRLALLEQIRSGRNKAVSYGTITTLEAYLADARHMLNRDADYVKRMLRMTDEILSAGERGEDLLKSKRRFFWRGYRTRFNARPLMYSIYVPDKYNPEEKIPVIISLHGGSSNHNVWMAMNLGNPIPTSEYWASFRKPFVARQHPKVIVVAPDGLGQIRWRFSGEQDIFDVLEDVKANYNVDPDKVFISGLSNGGIGSYTVGLKHASRFAGVLPMAGVANWLTHHEAVAKHRPSERKILINESAITWAENAANTNLAFFHGVKDSGFKIHQARDLVTRLKSLGVKYFYQELGNRGHDLSSVLWRDLHIQKFVDKYTRKNRPAEVRLVTASDRAARQFWLEVNERVSHVDVANLRGIVENGNKLTITTSNVARFTVDLRECPITGPIVVKVDDQIVYRGPIPKSGDLTLSGRYVPSIVTAQKNARPAPMWRIWDGIRPTPGTVKVSRLSGPLYDAQYDAQVHVYGTLIPEEIPSLSRAAYRGARSWVMAEDYSDIRFPVIADTDLSWDLVRTRTVVLYGNAANNSVLAKIGNLLPIEVGKNEIRMRGKTVEGQGVGARFICPNPMAPNRYLVVVAGATAQAVLDNANLPIYLADYIVYNAQTVKKKAFMVLGGREEIETGFFTENWRLPANPPPK